MKKIFSVLALAFFLSNVSVSAEVISSDFAKITADNLLSADSEFLGAGDAAVTLVEENGVPVYYVVEYAKGGWAIVSAQSSTSPLIAYNPTGKYEVPEPMQAVLNYNKERIANLAKVDGDTYHIGWSKSAQRKPAAEPSETADIAPLITVNLDQSNPFNAQCPMIKNQRVLVGCVAVAMGQAMMVARYPERGTGTYSYTAKDIGTLSVDFNTEPDYDWDAMYASPTTNNYDEIARLLYHCGVTVNMGYGVEGSGAITSDVATALVRNFKYDSSIVRHIDKPSSKAEWESALLDELVLGRAIVYHGSNTESGHAWNIDGWKKSTQMFHINWGWGGYGNAYFDIEAMEDKYQNMSFPLNNGAVIGVGAPTTAPYGLSLSKTKFALGTAPNVALADVTVSCEDPNAQFDFTVQGPVNITGKYTTSPYKIENMKLISTEQIKDATKFKFAHITVTNKNTGESYVKDFTISINSAVSTVLSDQIRVYPTIASDVVTVDVPVVGGKYAIYSVSGSQVAEGNLDEFSTAISVSSLASGTYILRYVNNEGVGVKTFIVK